MKVSLEKEGTNVVKLGVEIDSDKAKKAYEVACRQLSQRVKIPGFRPGKVPRNMIEKTFGVDYIKREALEQLVPEVLGRVIMDEKLDVITEPQIDSWVFELGQPLQLNARFEVRPEVALGDYRGLAVKVPAAKLPEDAMDKALKSLAEARVSWQAVSGRAVAAGDTILMDFECHVEGKLVEGGKAEGLLLEIKEGNFLEGFCEQLVGQEPGGACEVKASFPDNYRNPELAGKDAVFQVQIKELRERNVPECNDELAKALGQESLDALKETLSQRLEEEVKQENETRVQRIVVDAAVAIAQVDIPQTMIDRERDLLMAHLERYFEQNGQSWEAFKQSPDFEKVQEEKREEARQRVLTSLVLGAVVRSESMSISEEETAPYLAELVARYNVPIDQVARDEKLRRAFDELRRQAMEEALTRKVVEYLTGQATIEFVPEEPAGEPVAAEASAS